MQQHGLGKIAVRVEHREALAARSCAIRLSSNVDLPVLVWPATYRCRRRVSGSSIANATGLTYNVPHYPGVGRDWRSEILNLIPKSSGSGRYTFGRHAPPQPSLRSPSAM